MNRLWVRLSLMITGVLFLVFFMQFASIMLDDEPGRGQDILDHTETALEPADGPQSELERTEITRRLFHFMLLSAVVGLVGGVVIAQVVSRPINELVRATGRIGKGDLSARVTMRGSREMMELAGTFNTMAADLQRAEVQRSNLMADVSHELRTPLTVLEGNLRAALDHVYALDEAEIANLYAQTRHLVRLVNDLRELALAEHRELPLNKAPTDLNALVDETLQAIEPLASEQEVRLTNLMPALPRVDVDPLRMRQVLFNLLSNALRHTPPGGEITVTGISGTGEIELAVLDTGEGLELGELAVVFDRFYRADKSRARETGGTGLGLAIVKAIVEAHGGRIEALSVGKGRGSKFVVYLPDQSRATNNATAGQEG